MFAHALLFGYSLLLAVVPSNQMTLHHVCAISLVLFSYYNNYGAAFPFPFPLLPSHTQTDLLCCAVLCCAVWLVRAVKIGSLVLFVHDIADVVGYAIKMSVDTQYTKVTLTLYAMLLVVWGFTRLYVFPFYILGTIFSGKLLLSLLLCYCLHLRLTYTAVCVMGRGSAVNSNRTLPQRIVPIL